MHITPTKHEKSDKFLPITQKKMTNDINYKKGWQKWFAINYFGWLWPFRKKFKKNISCPTSFWNLFLPAIIKASVVERAVGMIQVLWEEIIINSSVDVEENAIRQKDAITRWAFVWQEAKINFTEKQDQFYKKPWSILPTARKPRHAENVKLTSLIKISRLKQTFYS